MIKKLLYCIGLILLAKNNQAQEIDWSTQLVSAEFKLKKIIPPTPEAAALGKYGNVPVNLFTGTPNISLPLYQLKGNSLSLPIQLSYNAGGFNPQEIAPWTGLGWSLNAGGIITRSVNGNPDVATNYFISPSPLVVPNQTADPFGYFEHMEAIRKGYKEAQPDVYYYNFAGQSGKFLIKPDGEILKKEKNNYIITANIGGSMVIVDEKGIRYEFTQFEVSTMQADDISADVSVLTFNYPSTWYLTRIVSADGFEEIGFTYYTTPFEHYQFINYAQAEAAVYEETIPASGAPVFTGPVSKTSQPPVVRTKRKYLRQITFTKASQLITYIDFESAVDQRLDLDHSITGFPGERLLNSIKVYTSKTGTGFTLSKQFNFNFGYFANSGNPGWNYKRLRLNSVQEIPVMAGTFTPPPTLFQYNDNGLMPMLSSTEMDHWGFYNMGFGDIALVPNHSITNGVFDITASNRQPTLAGSSAFLINKITYPTSGYTSFEYELNQALNPGTSTVMNIGGVRIKKIIDYSYTNKKAIEKTYEYQLADGTSSGVAMVPQYFNSINYKTLGCPQGRWCSVCVADLVSQKIIYTVSASSVIGLGSVQGSHIGYSRVMESLTEVTNGQALGKTVYEYNMKPGTWDPHDDYIGNGDLLKKTVFDNGGKIQEAIVNTYNYIYQDGIAAVTAGIASAQNNKNILVKMNSANIGIYYDWYISSSCAADVVDSRIYKTKFSNFGWSVSSNQKQLTEQLFIQYDQLSNSYITSSKKFTYGNIAHSLPTRVEQTSSNNQVIVSEKKYPLDYTIPAIGVLDDNTSGIQLLKDKNIIGAEVESIQYRQNSDGSNKRYISGIINNYNPAIPYPVRTYRLEITAPLSSFTLSNTNGGVFSADANYKQSGSFTFNGNGNLVEQAKYQDISIAYIWDYNDQFAVAEVTNAQYNQIAYTSFETEGTGSWSSISNLSNNRVLTSAATGKYSYNLMAGNSITRTNLPSERQYIVSYWSQSNLPITVSSNSGTATVTSSSLSYNGWYYHEHLLQLNSTSVTLTANGNIIDELRLYPKDALMTTIAYDPVVGVIGQCSASNQITYFEYDGLSRLVNVKDKVGDIVKNYKYNFATDQTALTASVQSLFYSEVNSFTYYRQGCPAGSEPAAINYVVPYGKYVSFLNQSTANIQAQTDQNANGQAYANVNGLCFFWNTEQSAYFSKNDCLYEQGTSKCNYIGNPMRGSRILYTVPAHTYSTLVDLTTANNLALADIQANGQNYANTYCWCSCGAEGKKFINGTCETGTRYNSSSVYIGNGLYTCTYYYLFSDGSVKVYQETTSTSCPIY